MNKKNIIVALALFTLGVTVIYQYTQQADINYYKAHRYFEKGELEQAMKYYEKTIELNPSRQDALRDLSYIYQWTGKKEAAIKNFQKYLSYKPHDCEVKKSLAETYSWNKEYDKSISLYKDVINETNDINVKKQLAEVYIWSGRYSLAKEMLEAVLKDNPGDSYAKMLFAKALQYSGEPEKAIELYKELLKKE